MMEAPSARVNKADLDGQNQRLASLQLKSYKIII